MTNISLDVLKGARDMRLRGQLADLYDGYTASIPAPDPDPPPQPMQPQTSAYDEMLTPFQDLVAKNSPQGAPASPVVNNDPYDAMLEPFRAQVKPSPYAGALTTLGGTDESEALTQPGGSAYVAGSRPSAAAGAPLAAMSGAYDQSHQGKLVRIGQVARATGLDDEGARILQAVATTEGGLGGAIGDQGQSRGPYQFYEGGQMPAFRSWLKAQGIQGDPNTLVNDVDLATRFAASTYLGDAIRRGRAKGLSGDKLATYVQETGQVSVDPWKTGDNYRALFGGGKDPFAVQPAPAQAPAPPSYQPNTPVRGDTITEETVPAISQAEPDARNGATEGAYVPGGLGRPAGFNTSAYGRLDSVLSQQPVNDQSSATLEPGDFQIPGYNVSGDVPPDDGATSFATEPPTDAAADSLGGVPDVQVESPPQDPWARVGNAIRDALGFGQRDEPAPDFTQSTALERQGEAARQYGQSVTGETGNPLDTIGAAYNAVEPFTATGIVREGLGRDRQVWENRDDEQALTGLLTQLDQAEASGDTETASSLRAEIQPIMDRLNAAYRESPVEASERNPYTPAVTTAVNLGQGAAAGLIAPGLGAGLARNAAAAAIDPQGQAFGTGLELAGRGVGAVARNLPNMPSDAPKLGAVAGDAGKAIQRQPARTYDAIQSQIDDLETALEKKYGNEALMNADLFPDLRAGAFADLPKQASPIQGDELKKLQDLYRERDAVGAAGDTAEVAYSVGGLSDQALRGPATKEEIQNALEKLQQERNLAQSMGTPTDVTAEQVARRLYNTLSWDLMADRRIPSDLVGDFDEALRVAADFKGYGSNYGQSPKPLLDQVKAIVDDLSVPMERVAISRQTDSLGLLPSTPPTGADYASGIRGLGKSALQGSVAAGYEASQQEGATLESIATGAVQGALAGGLRHAVNKQLPGGGVRIGRAVSSAVDDGPQSFNSTPRTASDDADKILAARMKVAKGAPGAPVYNPEVGETFNLGRYLKNPTAISDRREGIQAVEGYIEKLTGQPALFGDSLWARTRVYEGRADAALAKLDHDVGPSLQQYRKAGGNLTELDVFLEQMDNTDKGMWIAKREGMPVSAVQRQRLFPGGATLQSEQAIRDAWTQRLGPAKSQALFDAADAVWSFTDGLAERLYKSGVIDQQTRLDWQENFPHYVRANILHAMDDANVNNLAPGGRLFGTASDGYKRLTQEGTSRMRQSPLATVIDMAAAAETRAQRNEIAQRVAAWADIPGMQGFVRRLGNDADPPEGWVAMNYLNDGKAERIAVVKQLEPSLTLGAEPHGLVATLVAGMAAPLKKGATALRPSFVVMNGINDALWFLYRAGIESPNPLEAIRAMTDLARGYRVAVGSTASGHAVGMAAGAIAANQTAPEDTSVGDRFIRAGLGGLAGLAGAKALGKIGGQADKDLLYRYRTSGASIYTGTRWDGRPELIAQELAGGRVWVRTIRNEADFKTLAKDTLGAVGDTLGLAYSRPIEAVGAPIELAPRLAAFARAERQGKTQLDAALASRRATVDFAAGGRLIKAANLAIPFLNPALQASLEFAQLSRQHPAKTAAAMATIAGAVIANEAYNRSVAPDDYQDVDKYIRDSGIVIMSDQEPDEGQKRGFAYIPLRGGIGAIVPMVRDAVARFYGDDPRPWQEIAKHVIGSVTPIPGDLSAGLSSLLPPVPALAYELQSNYDTFRDQPIIPRSLEGLPAQEQYTDRTSLTARALSESNVPGMGGKPPAAIEYGIRNFSPGPGETFLGLGDMILQATGTAPEGRSFAEREKTARDVPVTGGIIGRFSRVTGEARKAQAYETAGEIVEKNQRMVLDIVRNWPEYANATPDRQKQIMATANRYLSEYAQEVAGVETKPKDLGAPQRWLGVDPGSEYEREIVKAIGADTRDATPRQRMLAARYRGSETTQYKLWSDRKEKSSDKLKDAVRSSVEH